MSMIVVKYKILDLKYSKEKRRMKKIFKGLFIYILCLSLVLPNISLPVYANEMVNDVETKMAEIESDNQDDLKLTSLSENEISNDQILSKDDTEESENDGYNIDINKTQDEELKSITVNFSDRLSQRDGAEVCDASINANTDFAISEQTKSQFTSDLLACLGSYTESMNMRKYQIPQPIFEDLFYDIMDQNPQFFHVNGFTISYTNEYIITELKPVYNMDKDTFAEKFSKLMQVVNDFTKNAPLDSSDLEKVLYINDYLVLNIVYDVYAWENNITDTDVYKALVERKTVCMGYALAFQLLAKELGLSSQIVSSESLEHAWNMVLVDGKYYHVDTTWNDPIPDKEGFARHIYILKSTSFFQGDHMGDKFDWEVGGNWNINYANDKTYDDYFWNYINDPFYYVNGYWYNVTGINDASKYHYEGSDLKQIGTLAGFSGINVTGTGAFENLFYLSTKDSIYAVDPTNDAQQLIFQLSNEEIKTDGYISYIKLEPNGELYIYQKNDSTGNIKIKLATTLKQSISRYNVIFSGNGATAGKMENLLDRQYNKNYRLPINQYVRDKYIFTGWNTKADGTGVSYADGAIFKNLASANTTSVTLYAQWEEDSFFNGYKITYVLNGGVNHKDNPSFYYVDSEDIYLQSPTRTGYGFNAWYKDSGFSSNAVSCIVTGSSGDLTLYAKWYPYQYDIYYYDTDANTTYICQQRCKYGQESFLYNWDIIKPGYTFMGWNTKPDGSGVAYKANESVSTLCAINGGKVPLYAQWKADGDGKEDTDEDTDPEIIDMYEELSLVVGDSKSLNAKTSPAGSEITYLFYESDIINVDKDGIVTAKKVGSTWVTAALGKSTKECLVKVRNFVATPNELQLKRGEASNLVLEEIILDSQGTEQKKTIKDTLVWKIDDEMVAEILDQKNGKIQVNGIGNGSTYVTATIGINQDKKQNQVSIKIPVSVSGSIPIEKVFLNSQNLVLNQGEEQILKVTVLPYDTTDQYQIEWTISDPDKLEVIKDASKPEEMKVKAKKGGAVDVTAKVVIVEDGKIREELRTCKVIVHSSEGIPQPAPIEVLTNQTDTLSKVELPEGFVWKETEAKESEKITLTASDSYQTYVAKYENQAAYLYGEKEIRLAVGTITGIKAEGDLLLQVEDEKATKEVLGEITLDPLFKGMLPQSGYEYLEPVVESQYSSAVTITKKKDTQNVYEIRTTNPEAIFGKKIKVTFTLKVEGMDVTDKKQKGKGWFETTANLTVAAKGKTVAENIRILVDQKEVESLIVNLSSEKELQLETKVTDHWEKDITESTPLQFKSSNPKTAKIDKNGKVTITGEGNTILSVLAKDGSNCSGELQLEVRDFKPVLEESSILINAAGTEGTPIHLYPAYDQKEVQVKGISIYDSKTKAYTDGSHLFDIQKEGENTYYTVRAKGNAIPAKNKKTTYNIVINTKTTGSQEETTEYKDENGLGLKITVSNALPKVSVKQSGKINLFYKNAAGTLNLTSKDAVISKVEWKENSTDFILAGYQDGQVTVSQNSIIDSYQETNGRINANKVKKEGVLLVSFVGFKEPIEAKVKVGVEYKKPSFKLTKGAIGIHPEWNLYEGSDILIDAKTKKTVDLSQVSFQDVKDYTIQGDKEGKIIVKQDASATKPASKITLTMKNENWRGDVAVTCNVKNMQPSVILSQNKLVLNTHALVEASEPQKVIGKLSSMEGVTLASLRLQPADSKTKDAIKARTLLVKGDGDVISVAVQKVTQSGNERILTNGTYKFKITPTIQIGIQTESKELAAVTLTIQVVNKPPTVTLKGKNSINLLNREDVSGTTYTPKIANTTATITGVELSGADASKFEKPYLENGQLIFKAKETAQFALKRTYVVVPSYTMSDGSMVKGSVMKLKAVHPSLKFVTTAKNIVLNISRSGDKNGKLVDVLVNSKDSYLNDNQRIESITLNHKNFGYKDGKIYIKNPIGLTANKTVTLTLQVRLKGQAENSAPYKVTVKVNVRR